MPRTLKSTILTLSILSLLAIPSVASAHTGHTHGDSSLTNGLSHPISGLDHLLAMIGVGLWASQIGGRAKWIVPLAFVGSMVLGGVLQWAGVNVPQVEAGIAASVLILGLLIATTTKLPTWAAGAIVGLFAICHGAAHATEFTGSSAIAYSVGFGLSTIALHAVGMGLGVVATQGKSTLVPRLAGGAIAVCGVLIFTDAL